MKIGIAGPIATESVVPFLDGHGEGLPHGYPGAPLFGNLIGALLERGHAIVAYTTSSDMKPGRRVSVAGDRFKITYCAARPHTFRRSEGHWGRGLDAFALERAALAEAMREDAPDLVHAHWTYEFALAAIASGLPHLITCHDAPQVVFRYSPGPYRLARYVMARRALNQAQRLTAVSPYLKDKIASYARAPISVVPNPLPMRPASLRKPNQTYDASRPRIAMVLNGWGRLKNPQPALLAFAAVRRTFPAAVLTVMGADYGPGGKAERWAQAKRLAGGVHFLGPLPYSALLSRLAASDLLVHPSLEETFGMSVAEAMSLGVPVVGGKASGAVPWVVGDAGRLVDVRSATEIERAVTELLKDEQGLAALRTQARARAAAFSSEAIAGCYEEHYRQVAFGARN